MSYLLHHPGAALDGIVMHTCDNPACCNPAHLRVAIGAGDIEDVRPRRFAPRQRKLTDDQVRTIRAMAATGDHSDMEISLLFDVASTHVQAIRQRVRKGHVSDDGPMAAIPASYVRSVKGRES